MTDLTWAISSCALLLALIALRAVFGSRMKPGLRYALWGLALLRLLLPIQLFSAPWGVSAELPDRAAVREIDRPAAVTPALISLVLTVTCVGVTAPASVMSRR